MAEEKVYITVKGYGEARFEEKKSVFIGYCEHVTNEEEALAFVKKIKEKHKDATHNCNDLFSLGGGFVVRKRLMEAIFTTSTIINSVNLPLGAAM